MAEKKKSIIEEALLEAKSLEDALKANTKEILASTMKEEIESVVRESLNEQAEEEEITDELAADEEGIESNDEIEGLDGEMEDELPAGGELEAGDDSGELELDLDAGDADAELELDLDAGDAEAELELPAGDEEGMELDSELEIGDEEGMLGDLGDLEGLGDEEILDLTDEENDDEVLKVFRALGDEDEIEVVKDADGISLKDNTTGAEYYIKESEEDLNEEELCEGCESEEAIYEVELDDETIAEMELEDNVVGEMEEEADEEDVVEEDHTLARTKGKQRYGGHRNRQAESKRSRKPLIRESKRSRKPVTESKNNVRKESYEKLLKEYKELKTRNGEYKEALKVFKTKINEVALFNQNLAHVTRLFTEHSTTKKEKMAILGRFDNVETIKESKSLYKTIESEMTEKTPITESVEKKVNKTVESSKSNLNESTAYVDPQINAIKDLMKRIER
jgi:hypothetical protein